jgi:hypothetical protein
MLFRVSSLFANCVSLYPTPSALAAFLAAIISAIVSTNVPQTAMAQSYPSQKDVDVVIYGIYCGWGNLSPDYAIPPIDELDYACMLHDQCYDNVGRFDCTCDGALADRALELSQTLEDPRVATLAELVSNIFKHNRCLEL